MSIELTPIGSGFNLSKINQAFQKIEDEFNNNTLRRDGVALGEDNSMKVDLDMNSNEILNLPKAVDPTSPVRLQEINDLLSGVDPADFRLIKKYSPAVVGGETSLTVPDAPLNINVFVNGSLLHETDGDYAYNSNTGVISLTTALNPTDVVEVQYGFIVDEVPGGGSVVDESVKVRINIAEADGDPDLEIGDYVRTLGYRYAGDGGGGFYQVVAAGTGTADGGSYIDLSTSGHQLFCVDLEEDGVIYIDKFGASIDTDIDSTPHIQAAIDYIHNQTNLPDSKILGAKGGTYTLKTYYTETLPSHATGDKIALLIHDGEKCKVNFGFGRIIVDINSPGMAGLTAVVGFCQETGDQAFVSCRSLRIDGGSWPLNDMRPQWGIKNDYNVVKYSDYTDVKIRRTCVDGLINAGFVIHLTRVDCRFVQGSAANAGIRHKVESVDGDTATRTGIYMEQCVTDYCAKYGYHWSGGNGHTYCAINVCTADHIGRDESNQTITANVAEAAAYRPSSLFGFNMISCGAETSTRFIRATGVRSSIIQSCYTTALGTTEGSPVAASMEFDGFTEDVSVFNYRQGSVTNIGKKLRVTTPSGFNNTCVTVDRTILPSEREVIVTNNDSSAPYTIGSPTTDFYARGVRNPGGDAKLIGDPLQGRDSTLWFEQNDYFAEKNFYVKTAATDVTQPILTLTNPGNDGFLGVEIVVRVGGSFGSVINVAPTRYMITAAADGVNKAVTIADKLNTSGGNYLVSAAWNSETLEVTIDRENPDLTRDEDVTAAITVTAWGRASTTYQTFSWEEQV